MAFAALLLSYISNAIPSLILDKMSPIINLHFIKVTIDANMQTYSETYIIHSSKLTRQASNQVSNQKSH